MEPSTEGPYCGKDVAFVKVLAPFVLLAYLAVCIVSNHRNILAGFCCRRHQGTFFATNRAGELHHSVKRPSQFWAWDILDKGHLTQGFYAGPRILLAFRLVVVVLIIATFIHENDTEFNKFTNWTFVLAAVAAASGAALCVMRLLPHAYQRSADSSAPEEWNFFDKLFMLSYVCALCSGITLTIFYWAVIAKHDTVQERKSFSNLMKHGIVYGTMLIDLVLSRIPVVSYHYTAIATYGSVYLIFMWIYDATHDDATIDVAHNEKPIPLYKDLDIKKSCSLQWYIVLTVLLTASFFLAYAVAGLREYLSRGKFECCGYCPCGACQPEYGKVTDLEAQGLEYRVYKRTLVDIAPKQELAFMVQGDISKSGSVGSQTWQNGMIGDNSRSFKGQRL